MLVAVLVGSALFVYLRLQIDLDESLNAGLEARAARAAGPNGERGEGLTQVLTADGRLIRPAGPGSAAVITPAEARRAARGPIFVERHVPGIEGQARLLARPAPGGRVVVVGQSLQDRDDTLRGLATSFAVGGPVGVLIASLLGYLLARAGLRPVDAMRRRAEQVSLERSGDRLPLPAAHDEVRALGETLNQMLARLEASLERERRFVADASHELRTPLAVLKTELETALRASAPGDGGRESLGAALEETDQLAQLAEDLLLIAHAQGGRLPVRAEAVAVRPLLDQARDRFVDRADAAGRAIAVDAPAELRAELDPQRLRQALGNLVDNALRHGEGDVAISARSDDGDLLIEVADAGPGFAPGFAPRAFERFAAADQSRGSGGAGLGLAIVRAIVEAHGGSAEIAHNGVAPGAVVQLRLPARA